MPGLMAAAETPAFENTQELQHKYVLSRSYKDSVRLSAQHWMFSMIMGYQLHPQARQIFSSSGDDKSEIHVADIGCGNGAWPFELYRGLSSSQKQHIHFHGIDISESYLPATKDRPSTFSVSLFDAVNGQVPEELVRKFDIVHVRMFIGIIRGNNPHSIIRNAYKMLKPGGYLQWDEIDLDKWDMSPPDEHTVCQKSKEWLKALNTCIREVQKLEWDWMSKLGLAFHECNLEVLDDARFECPPEFRKILSDELIMANENVGAGATRVSNNTGVLPGSNQDWESMLRGMIKEVNQGVVLKADMVSCLGRKPLLEISQGRSKAK